MAKGVPKSRDSVALPFQPGQLVQIDDPAYQCRLGKIYRVVSCRRSFVRLADDSIPTENMLRKEYVPEAGKVIQRAGELKFFTMPVSAVIRYQPKEPE